MERPVCCNFGCIPLVGEPFRHRIRVRFNECDGQGVVFYANYLMYFDVAITELLREAVGDGYSGLIGSGVDMMVAEATIRYRAPARFDDELDLVVSVTRMGTTSTVTHMEAVRVADETVLAEGELRHVYIDLGTLEKTEIPDEVRAGMGKFSE
jgi:acyl-CoA thioester hydrolase